ncbi:MAG: hypothetical protein ACRBI6_09115 [Acidimicrobiales bacterium]
MEATSRTPPRTLRIVLAVWLGLAIVDVVFSIVRDRSLADLALDLSAKTAGIALLGGAVLAAEHNRRAHS